MEKANIAQLMKKLPSECNPQGTTTELRIFNQQERDSVAYFYLRLSNIYGREYRSQLPDEASERISKREHGGFICGYTREQIDKGCTWIHRQKQISEDGWQFMDIDRCIGAVKEANRTRALHKHFEPLALPDKGAQERAKQAGVSELAKLNAMFP